MNRWQRRFLGSTSLSYDLTDFELVHFFALTDHEREAVRGRYKPNHRIAAALQIGFLKLAGRPLAAFKIVPAGVLEYVATQLGERAPTIASLRALYKRRATRFAHQAWAIDLLGLKSFSPQHRAALKAFLDTEARAASSVKALIQVAREWLYDRQILIPAESTLREVAFPAYKQSDEFHFDVICVAVPEQARARWIEAVFTRKDGESRTIVEWLQDPPRKRSPATLTRQFKKTRISRIWAWRCMTLRRSRSKSSDSMPSVFGDNARRGFGILWSRAGRSNWCASCASPSSTPPIPRLRSSARPLPIW